MYLCAIIKKMNKILTMAFLITFCFAQNVKNESKYEYGSYQWVATNPERYLREFNDGNVKIPISFYNTLDESNKKIITENSKRFIIMDDKMYNESIGSQPKNEDKKSKFLSEAERVNFNLLSTNPKRKKISISEFNKTSEINKKTILSKPELYEITK